YQKIKGSLMPHVEKAFMNLSAKHDLILVEGAGSPAEINLRDGDIANMGFATKLSVPTIIIGDIDRGGVIASLVGTKAVLDSEDNKSLIGFIINRFRGDPKLFKNGILEIEKRTQWKFLGLVPYYENIHKLPAEDSHDLEKIFINNKKSDAKLTISVPILSKISNFDDLDPLRNQKNININYVRPGDNIPQKTDIILLLGSKSTISDLRELRENNWDREIRMHHDNNGVVIGLCGGYQMLGKFINDNEKIESSVRATRGLELLDVETEMINSKIVTKINGKHIESNKNIIGYEIHIGRTHGKDCERPLFLIDNKHDGAQSANGRVFGTYVHGIFHNRHLIEWLFSITNKSIDSSEIDDYEKILDQALNDLADHLEKHISWKSILDLSKNNTKQ
ncbi:MAG: cobyric acid synthase, partial [Pseudomonadota bacterium]|nr:cobyric acid synthase [Pseudomonadota bacterium]